MSSSSGDTVARKRKRIPDSASTRVCSQAVTSATPAMNGSTERSRSAHSDSPTVELTTQARKLKSWWLFGM